MEFDAIRAGIIGEHRSIETPFGEKPLVYADYTASGRAYAPIEDFIRERVLPYYANTHSESSLTGRQTNELREQARRMIRRALNAGDEHAVIFCGSGATAAINQLVDILRLRVPVEPTVRIEHSPGPPRLLQLLLIHLVLRRVGRKRRAV